MSSERASFPTTAWSRIRIGDGEQDEARALETLALAYSRPIASYLERALSRSRDEAADLAQDFFVWAIETRFLGKADPARGRFRAFLKVALRRYALDADRRAVARKRGGDARHVPLEDGASAAGELALAGREPSPEEALDAAWRAELVERALERTRAELEQRGKAVVFAVFRDYFLDPAPEVDYRAVAEHHGIGPTDVSNHLMRAKALYRAHLSALVLETVRSRDDLDQELAWLVADGNPPRRGP